LDHGPNRPGGRLGHGHFHDFYHLHRIPVLPSLHALTRPQRYLRLLHIIHDVFQRLRDGLPPQGTYTFHVSATASNQTVPALLLTEMTQPNPPHINNFAVAQSVNATQAFILGWDAFVGGISADYVFVDIGN